MFTMIIGLPNAGKTTYSSEYKNVIHIDEVRSKEAIEMIKQADDVCVEGVFPFSNRRKDFLKSYNGNGKKICIWLNTAFEECVKRENRNRNKLIIENCREYFEPPTYDEGWDEIIIIEDNNDESISNTKQT